ncbi:MAG: hypothetical protein KDE53_17160, partial [Caldilineaceae bacterium]|nr:hypothetical protein [Caldilineaceae bacterium]
MVTHLRLSLQRHTAFCAILVLAVSFRLLALLLFRPGGFIADASDYDFYYVWGQQIPQGYETFVNLWTAYPPLFPAVMLPIFEWSSRIPPWSDPRLFFHLLFGLVLLLFESGNLILIYRLARKLGYPALGRSSFTVDGSQLTVPTLLHPAIFYAFLFTPVYTLLGWFEAMPLFFMLWGLDLLLSQKRGRWLLSAVVAALGFLTKLTPALLVPIAIRWLGSKLSWSALRAEWFKRHASGNLLRPTLYTLLFLGVVIGGGYWLVGGHTALALSSFQVNALRPPWESVWALLVGNYDWGRVPVDMRNLPALQNPPATAQLPWNWITFAFVLLYLWLYTRRYDWNSPRTPVVFAAISVIWLFLYSKGWSPQFLVWILAFVVLLLPNWHGVALSIGLSLLNVIESPIFFTMLGNEPWILAGVILLRTALLVILVVELCGQIWPSHGLVLRRVAATATGIVLLLTITGIIAGLPRAARAYAEQRLADYRCVAVVDYLRQERAWPNHRIVSDQIAIWRDLYPWLREDYTIRIIDGYDPHDRPWEEMIRERLAAYVGNQEFWWVTYLDQPSHADSYFAQPNVHVLEEQQWGQCLVRRVMQTAEEPLVRFQTLGGPIQLKGIILGNAEVGAEMPLVLYWQSE